MSKQSTSRQATAARRKQKRKIKTNLVMAHHDTNEQTVTLQVLETSDEQAEQREFVEILARSFHRTVEFYRHCEQTPEQAWVTVDKDRTEEYREYVRSVPLREISWYNISLLADGDVHEALEVWGRIRAAALDEWESGMLSAETVGANTPFERARYLVIRDRFTDGWMPQNALEGAMIEMLAETFALFQHWTAIAHTRAVHIHDEQKKNLRRFEESKWKSPYQSEADAIEQAHNLAKGYHRQFLSTLRHLRDFRRYSVPPPAPPPVIVNQGGQVNVGNQQVNVARPR
jgi:hypothetical protein